MGWMATIFSMGALCFFALKVMHRKHFSTCSPTCMANQGQKKWLCIKSSILLRSRWLTSFWHPPRVVSQCLGGKTSWNRVSWDSFDRIFLYRMPHLNLRWLHSRRNCQSLGGSVSLNGHLPRVPSCILTMTRSRTGSTYWAWCKFFVVVLATCGLSPTRSRTCRSQLYASMGLTEHLRAASYMALTTTTVTQWWVSKILGMHLGQDTFIRASVCYWVVELWKILYGTTDHIDL